MKINKTTWTILWTTLAWFSVSAQGAKIYPDDCPGMTLQQCVDSDNGGTGAFFITVKNGTYNNQDVSALGRSGWIVAEGGVLGKPVFTDSFWTWDAIGTATSGVRGIHFTGDSSIQIFLSGTVNAGEMGQITIDDNEFEISTTGAINFSPILVSEISLGGAGTFGVRIRGNQITASTGAAPSFPKGLIDIDPMNSTVDVDVAIAENTLQTNREDVPGLMVKLGTANLDVILSQNEFRGARAVHLTSSTGAHGDLNFYAYYNLFADRYADGTITLGDPELVYSNMQGTASRVTAGFYFNTFDGRWDLVNFSNHAITASSSNQLLLYNNVFTEAPPGGSAILLNGIGTASVSGDNNVIGPGLSMGLYAAASGPGDQVGVDPLYVAAPARYALRDGSPAIDTGGNADFGFGFAQLALFGNPVPSLLALPHVDLDGFRRVIDGDGDGAASADAGAFEWGDRMLVHESSNNNNSFNQTAIHDDELTADSDAVGLFTHIGLYEDTPEQLYDQPLGWWFNSTRWTIYNENSGTNMNPGLVYSVFHPTGDRGVGTNGLRGMIEVQNGPSAATSLDTGLTESNLAVFVRHVFQGGSQVYDNSALEVYYDGTSWRIYHANSGTIPANATYLVYYQQPSKNVIKVIRGIGDAGSFGGAGVVFQHPLLTDPCVTPVIQQVALGGLIGNGLGDVPHHVLYENFFGFGSITTEDGSNPFSDYSFLNGGTGYFVMIDPQQAFECSDRIYKDDMDH